MFRKKSKAVLMPEYRESAPATIVLGGDPDNRAPDTRMLSSLGGCTSTVSTVVEDAHLPLSPTLLDFPRRQSTASAMSSASTILATPTYPTEPIWQQRRASDNVSVAVLGLLPSTLLYKGCLS